MPKASEHTNAYKLFHYPFYCKVPAMFTITQDELDVRGAVTSGRPELDRAIANEPMDIRCTIRQMIEYRREGAQITLIRPKEDSVRIYDILTGFLGDIQQQMDRSFNVQIKDQELVQEVDEFAAEVYKIARHFIKTGVGSDKLSIFERGPSGLGLKGKSKVKVKLEKEHKPMAEDISIKALERTKSWQ